MECKINNCGNESHTSGYCKRHYDQIRNNGKIIDWPEFCSLPDCNNKHVAKGYCGKHYQQAQLCGKTFKTKYEPNTFITEGLITKIECLDTKGNFKGYIVISTIDSEECKQYKWRIRNGRPESSKFGRRLYNLIMKLPINEEYVIDHKDGDPLNNTRDNLRIATFSQNTCNSKIRSDNTSGYKGVSFKRGKFVACITKDGISVDLGKHETAISAALAYNKAAKELHGEFAVLNKLLKRRTS